MDYTLSNAYTTDAGTGNRMHQQSAATTTAVEDKDMNGLIWELLTIIKAGGLAPVAFDKTVPATYTQVAAAIQSGKLFSAAAAGTADAITATFTPGITALKDGMALYVRGAAANATTTPTFTPASGTIAAKAIVKGAGSALAVGDIAGAGHWVELQYDLTLDKWVLLNPATGVTAGGVQYKGIQPITSSVAANALTVGLNPTTLDFRSSVLTNGVPNTRTVGAALSLVVPSGATLGMVNATQARLALLAIDNAGTVELAIVNLAGGVNLDETTLISTTAISAAATSAGVVYSTTARASVPFRVVGFLDITEATAGTWATDATLKQGMGGNTYKAMPTASMIRLNTANGYGSTNTGVRRFTNVVENLGGDITYTDSATLGGSFTINSPGVYGLSFSDNFTAASDLCISKNATVLTALPTTVSEVLSEATSPGGSQRATAACSVYLRAGDVIRAHGSGTTGTGRSFFTITKGG